MVRILAVVPVVVLAFASAAFAACPPNYVGTNLTSPGGTPITAAVHRDSLCTFQPCLWKSQWNNTLGTARIDAHGPGCPTEIRDNIAVGQYTSDDFVLTGPSGPNPVSFQVLLHVTGSTEQGIVSATLGDGTQSVGSGQVTTLATTLAIGLSKLVGEPFHLDRGLYATAVCSAAATMSSQLELVLPPGYGATSCYGFSAAGPTPALPATWGRLKSTYRE